MNEAFDHFRFSELCSHLIRLLINHGTSRAKSQNINRKV